MEKFFISEIDLTLTNYMGEYAFYTFVTFSIIIEI